MTDQLKIDIVAKDKSVQAFNSLQNNVSKTKNSLLNLKNILLAVASSVVVGKYFELSSVFENLQNKLRPVLKSSSDLKSIQNELFNISQKTNSRFTDTVETFSLLARETDHLSLSNKDLLQLTENVNKLVRSSGVSADRASNAIFQLAQAFSLGELQANDFKIQTKGLPRLLDILSESLGVTKEQLKEMSKQGKITGEILLQTILGNTEAINLLNTQVEGTLLEAISNMNNSFLNLVGNINEVTGATGFLKKEINGLSKALDEMSKKENLPITTFELFGGVRNPIIATLMASLTKQKIDANTRLKILENHLKRNQEINNQINKITNNIKDNEKKIGAFQPNRLFQLHLNEDIKVMKALHIEILEKLKLQNKEYSLSNEIFNLINLSVSSFSRKFAEAVVLGRSLNISFKEFAQSIMVDVLAKMIERLALLSIEKILTKDSTDNEIKKLDIIKEQNSQLKKQLLFKTASSFFPFKASGGAVGANKPVIVGERGAELFIPNSPGQITQSARGLNTGSTNINFNITTNDASGFEELLIRSRGTITQLINNAVNERGVKNLI